MDETPRRPMKHVVISPLYGTESSGVGREHSAYHESGGDQVAQSILLDVPLRPNLPESNFVKCRIVGLP